MLPLNVSTPAPRPITRCWASRVTASAYALLELADSSPTTYSVLPSFEKRTPPSGRDTFVGNG